MSALGMVLVAGLLGCGGSDETPPPGAAEGAAPSASDATADAGPAEGAEAPVVADAVMPDAVMPDPVPPDAGAPDVTAAAGARPDGAVPDATPIPAVTTPPAAAPTPASAPSPAAAPTPAAALPSDGVAAAPPADVVAAAPPEAPPASARATYTLDPRKSSLYVQVYKDPDTAAAGLSHDHVVVATGWRGTVTWDPADPAACAISLDLPVSGLQNDADAMRKRVGYDTTLSDGQRSDVKGNMLGSSQLDAARFPTITFTARTCAAAGDRVKVTGDLGIHGVTRSVTAAMKITADPASFAAKGSFSANATQFGFDPYSAMFGALRNKDEMAFSIDVRGTPQ